MALYVLERTGWNLALYAGNAALTLGLDLVLIPRWGLPGAVVPTALMIAISPLLYALALRRIGARVALPLKFLARCCLASAALLLLLPLRLLASPALTLTLAALLAVPALWLGMRAVRLLGPEETREIDRLGPGPFVRALRLFTAGGGGRVAP
jgi:hypothetical protein